MIEEILKDIEGFEYSQYSISSPNYVLAGDGSSVVRIYYTLKIIEFKVSYSSGIKSITVEGYNNSRNLELVGTDPVTGVLTYRSKYSKRLSLSVELEEGFELYGWILNDNKQPELNSNETRGYLFDVRSEDFSLKAIAITKLITIRFNPNNGSSEIIEMQVYYGSENVRLRKNTFTNGNNKFVGWALSADGDVAYFDEDVIEIVDFNETLTLYAVWEAQPGSNWWIYLLIVLLILLLLLFIIILIMRKRRKDRNRMMSKQ